MPADLSLGGMSTLSLLFLVKILKSWSLQKRTELLLLELNTHRIAKCFSGARIWVQGSLGFTGLAGVFTFSIILHSFRCAA